MVIGVKVNPFVNVPISAGAYLPPEFSNGVDFEANRHIVNNQLVPVDAALTEDRASSAWPLQSNGTYVERAPGELAIGQGVGLQVSQAVTNYVAASNISGAVVGVPGSYPVGWTGLTDASGVQREIVGIGERAGLPTLKLRFYGEWDAGHPGYTNIALCATSAMPITEDDQLAHGIHIAVIAGSIAPVSFMNLNSYYRLSHAYKGQYSTAILSELSDEFKQFTGVTASLAPTGGVCDAVDTQLYFAVPVETPFDFTLEIGAPFLSPIAFVPPVNIGSGTTTTRAADNPVVVQGEGPELMPFPTFASLDGLVFVNSAVDVTPGSLTVTNLLASEGSVTIVPEVPLIAGALYRIKLVISDASTTTGGFDVGGQRIAAGGLGERTIYVVAGAGSTIGVLTNNAGLGDYVTYDSVEISQVLPYPGYSVAGIAGTEFIPNGAFDDLTALDGWETKVYSGIGTTTLDVVDGQFVITNSDPLGTGYGVAEYPFQSVAGAVYVINGDHVSGPNASDYHLGNPSSYSAYLVNKALSQTPKAFLASYAEIMRLTINSAGNTPEASRVVDNLSLQRVKPGVVIEAVGVWGDTVGQHVLRLDDASDATTFMLAQRSGDGKVKLKIVSAGATLFEQDTTSDWPDNTEGTFRLELTDTTDGCFAALFLDEVFILGSDAFTYPTAIDQLDLSPVAGIKTSKQVYTK